MTLQNGLRLEEFMFKKLSNYVLGLKERWTALIIQNAIVYTCLIKKGSSLTLLSGVECLCVTEVSAPLVFLFYLEVFNREANAIVNMPGFARDRQLKKHLVRPCSVADTMLEVSRSTLCDFCLW